MGGAVGASLRYLASTGLRFFYPNFPYGTLFVNILGSFLIGFLMSYLENKNISENFVKYFLIIGLLGSFTTYSAFSFETIDMMQSNKFLLSFIYILLSVVGCLLFAFLGYNINKI